ncbi:MAG: hypothetical protein JXA13_10800 [Anaerolineales bacterium]|nr:hypothetical protein [Anaerolineales bacterium]
MSEILEMIASSLGKIYENHIYLIEKQVSERSIVFWFGVYFHEILQGTEYSEYDLDVEYNRNMREPKRTQHSEHSTYPDLILHKRGSNESNFLIIEFKPWWNPGNDSDLQKLQDFTNPDSEYKYEIGLSILIGLEMAKYTIIKKGEIKGEF